MAIDPTKWRTSADAWRYWMAMAEKCEKAMYEIRLAYEAKQGRSAITDIEIKNSSDYRNAVGDAQWARENAMMYGHAVHVQVLQQVLRELKELKTQQRYDPKDPPTDLSWIQTRGPRDGT